MNYVDLANRLSRLRLNHRAYVRCNREFHAHLSLAAGGDVIILIGPSRVGKSTILRACLQYMFKEHADHRHIPYVIVDASQTNQGCFTLKQLWADLLGAMEHPSFSGVDYLPRKAHTEASLRSTVVRTIAARKTKIVCVDEGMTMLHLSSRGGPTPALDTLKSLGNETDAAIVICGDYTLLDRCFLSPHLNGRMVLLEFPGYSQSKEDSIEFTRILASVDQNLPWFSGQSLVKHRDFIYAGTAGCCGSIIKWSRLALAQMGAESRNHLLIRDFERTRRIEQAESFHALNERRHLLQEMRSTVYQDPDPDSTAPAKKTRKYRPGQRNPTRDPVGPRPA